jgi:hypothetical protein
MPNVEWSKSLVTKHPETRLGDPEMFTIFKRGDAVYG